jgi:hypothetical protein
VDGKPTGATELMTGAKPVGLLGNRPSEFTVVLLEDRLAIKAGLAVGREAGTTAELARGSSECCGRLPT